MNNYNTTLNNEDILEEYSTEITDDDIVFDEIVHNEDESTTAESTEVIENNIIAETDTESEEQYLTLADGTDITGFELKCIDFIKVCTLAEIKQWYKAFEVMEKCYYGAINKQYIDILSDGYIFPDYAEKYFGYIIKTNFYHKEGKKYYKLYIALGNGSIPTVTFSIEDTNNVITKALKRYFGGIFTAEELKYKLVKFQIKNRINRNGNKYTDIQKCRICCEDFENDLSIVFDNLLN